MNRWTLRLDWICVPQACMMVAGFRRWVGVLLLAMCVTVHAEPHNGDPVTVTNPVFRVNPVNDRIWGHAWPEGATVTVTLPGESDTLLGTAKADEVGDWWIVVQDHDIRAGDVLRAVSGEIAKEHQVVSLIVADVNIENQTIHGAGMPGRAVVIEVYDEGVGRTVQADAHGNWIANFSVRAGEDPWEDVYVLAYGQCRGAVYQEDEDGDATYIQWITPPSPFFSVSPNGDQAWGHFWRAGDPVALVINGTEIPNETAVDAWGDWRLDVPSSLLQPGNEVLATVGSLSVPHTIKDLHVTLLDVETDTVHGTAEPYSLVWVYCFLAEYIPGIFTPSVMRQVQADSHGVWVADFSQSVEGGPEGKAYDINYGSFGCATQWDNQSGPHGSTTIGWHVPIPFFMVDYAQNAIWGHAWPEGQTVTVMIGDPGEPYVTIDSSAIDDWGDWHLWVLNHDIQPGDAITVTCGDIIKQHTVTELTITDVDADMDTVRGTAAPHTWIDVHIHEEDVGRRVQADESGVWMADFSSAAGLDHWDRAFDIEPGTAGVAGQRDDENDETHLQWRVSRPFFRVDYVGNSIWGHEWPEGETVTVTIGDPEAPYVTIDSVAIDDWGNWHVWGMRYNIQPGERVTVLCGDIVKQHVVTELAITDVDTETDTVSGTAVPRTWIDVHVYDADVGRRVQAGEFGGWMADFSSPAGEGQWNRAYDIAPGITGAAGQRDDENDETHLQWRAETPRPIIRAIPPSHDFGNVNVGVVVTQSFDIVNAGKLDLDIYAVDWVDGDDLHHVDVLHQSVAGSVLAPRGAQTGRVTVVFSPLSHGDKAVALRIECNDPANPDFTIPLYGTGRPEGQAQDHFEAGLTAMAGYLHESGQASDLIDADGSFDAAILADGQHYGAIVYRMFTRLLTLPYDASVAGVLDAMGASETGRDLLDWTAGFPDPLPSTAPSLDRIVDVVSAVLDARVAESLEDLSRIPADWTGSVVLRPDYLPVDNEVQFDAGDALMLQSMLHALRGILTIVRAHDWYFDFKHVDHLDTPRRTVTVDGDPSDWEGIRPLTVDAQGNHDGPESVDIHRVYTAMDDTFAYIMIDTHADSIHAGAPISVILNFKPGRHMWLDEPIDGHDPGYDDLGIRFGAGSVIDAWDTAPVTLAGVTVARGAVFEAAIPLAALDHPDYVTATYVNIWPDGLDGNPGNPISIAPRIGDYLDDYPLFGAVTNAGAFAQALHMFVAAIDGYMDASLKIRSETDWQGDDLFTFDPDALDAEQQFRMVLHQIRDSMTGDSQSEPFSYQISRFVDLKDLFEHPFSLRELRTGTGIQDTMVATMLRQITYALDNLSSLDDSYAETLTPDQAPVTEEIHVDYGDIAMTKSWLNAWKSALHAVQAYDAGVDIVATLERPFPHLMTSLFDEHEHVLTVEHPAKMAAASNALAAALEGYVEGSRFLRAREDGSQSYLVAVSNNHLRIGGGLVTDHEDRFRNLILDLTDSLDAPRPVQYRRGDSLNVYDEWLHIGRFFADPYVTRDHLPRFDADNRVVEGSFPDETFNGIFPDMSLAHPPATPQGLRVVNIGPDGIALLWEGTDETISGYQLQRRDLPRGDWRMIAGVSATHWMDDVGLVEGGRYAYRIRAYNWVGYSGYGDPVIAVVPVAPGIRTYALSISNIVATLANGSIPDLETMAHAMTGSEMDVTFDARLTNPESVTMQHRVAAGWRDTAGDAVGMPVEVPGLTAIPNPVLDVWNANLPAELRIPDAVGDYSLWIESHVGAGDPRETFRAAIRIDETDLARKILRVRAVAPSTDETRVWMPDRTGIAGETISVPVTADAAGHENAFSFSLAWDPEDLEFVAINTADATRSARLVSHVTDDRVGVALMQPAGTTLAGGSRVIATARFRIRSNAAVDEVLTLTLGDAPTARMVSDPLGAAIPYAWEHGSITVISGLEADVSPRGRPDGQVTDQDRIQMMRFVAGIDVPMPGREFQAADCAPHETRGDGMIDLRDAVVAALYTGGYLPPTGLGGPMQAAHETGNTTAPVTGDRQVMIGGITLRVGGDGAEVTRGEILEVPVSMETGGGLVAGASFSVAFDPDELTYLKAVPAGELAGVTSMLNDDASGQGAVGYAMRLMDGHRLPAGDVTVITMVFRVAGGHDDAHTVIAIADDPTAVILLDGSGVTVQHATIDASISLRAAPPDGLPGMAGGLSATIEAIDRLVLRWDAGANATAHRIYRRDNGGPWIALADLAASTRHYVDGGIRPAGEYDYRVASINAAGMRLGDAITVVVPSRYRFWTDKHAGHFLGEPFEDADGDGISNYLEYLMGTDPLSADRNLLRYRFVDVYGPDVPPFFTVSFDLRSDIDPARVAVDATEHLVPPDWQPAPMVMNVISNGYRRLKFRVFETESDHQFIRVYPARATD